LRKLAKRDVVDRDKGVMGLPGPAFGDDTAGLGEVGADVLLERGARSTGTTGSNASPKPILLLRFRIMSGAVKIFLAEVENFDLSECSNLGEVVVSRGVLSSNVTCTLLMSASVPLGLSWR
jgi:hypothetical protein